VAAKVRSHYQIKKQEMNILYPRMLITIPLAKNAFCKDAPTEFDDPFLAFCWSTITRRMKDNSPTAPSLFFEAPKSAFGGKIITAV
jgi:hypothetical protein